MSRELVGHEALCRILKEQPMVVDKDEFGIAIEYIMSNGDWISISSLESYDLEKKNSARIQSRR